MSEESRPAPPKILISSDRDWIMLRGRTLAQIEAAAVRSSYLRNKGCVSAMRRELGLARTTIWRKLRRLGLGKTGPRVRHLREIDIARAFQRHRKAIAKELQISDSTLVTWLNRVSPLTPDEG
jgi:transcriptional regulator with PAS, ATPase and Fis domain